MDYTLSTQQQPHLSYSLTSFHRLPLFNRTSTFPTLTPPCIPGEKVPYPDPPPPTITQNISFPFPVETYPEWEVGLKAFGYSVAMAMAVLGNLLVIATVCCNRMMHSCTNFYIANLAVSDLMVGSLNMWMHLVMSITVEWPFNATICKAFPFLQILSLTASVLSMTVIAADRYLAIVHPLKARLSKTHQHAVVMVIVWCIAVAVAVPNLLVREMSTLIWADYYQVWCGESWPRYVSDNQGNSTGGCVYEYPGRQLYYNLQAVVMYFVTIVVMTFAYGVIIWRLNHRLVPGEQTAATLALQRKVTAKVVTMLVVVLIVFFICWTPQEIVVIMDANWPEYSSSHISEDMRFVFIFVAYFNSSLNPIIYAVLNSRFRQGFKELWRKTTSPIFNNLRNNKIQPENEINSPEVKTAQMAQLETGNEHSNDVTVIPEVNSPTNNNTEVKDDDTTTLRKP